MKVKGDNDEWESGGKDENDGSGNNEKRIIGQYTKNVPA